jgi:hypothetical protein
MLRVVHAHTASVMGDPGSASVHRRQSLSENSPRSAPVAGRSNVNMQGELENPGRSSPWVAAPEDGCFPGGLWWDFSETRLRALNP